MVEVGHFRVLLTSLISWKLASDDLEPLNARCSITWAMPLSFSASRIDPTCGRNPYVSVMQIVDRGVIGRILGVCK